MKNGFDVGGFDAYVTTQVIPSAGVSSSASYEMLICAIINFMFNDNTVAEVLGCKRLCETNIDE